MDINSKNWVVLNNSPAQQPDNYQFTQAIEINGEAGILAVSTQALPTVEHSLAYYLQNQRSQKGAEFAIKASREAFEILQEQQLDFDRDYLSLLIKYWNYYISLHFIANPLSQIKKNGEQKNNTLSNNAPNALLNLTSLYDTAISVILLTDKQLQVYQVANTQLLLLNKQHIIETHTPKLKRSLSFPQYLAHPDLTETYSCLSIDITDYELEMLILDAQPNHAASLLEQHAEIYQLARQLDTQGVSYVEGLQDDRTANQIIIKRNRFGYDSVTHALNRESYHLHHKVDFQSRQINQLETEIYQLSLSQQTIRAPKEKSIPIKKATAYVLPEQPNKLFSIGTVVAMVSAFALVTTSTIAYSLWQNSHSNIIRVAQNNTETVESNPPLSRNTVLKKSVERELVEREPVESEAVTTTSTLNNVFSHYQAPKSEDKALEKEAKNQFVNIDHNNLTTSKTTYAQHRLHDKQRNLQQVEKKQATNLAPIEKVAAKVNPVDLIIADLKKNKIKAPPPLPQAKKEPVIEAKISKQRVPSSKVKPRSQQQHKIRHKIKVARKPRKEVIKKPVHKAVKIKPKRSVKAIQQTRVATTAQVVQKKHYKPVKQPTLKAIQVKKNQSANIKKASYAMKKRMIRKNQKVMQNKIARAKRDLENAQKQTIIQQIIANSTTFASHTLRLKKKHKEIGIMNKLFIATKNHYYAKQKQLLERREGQLKHKMEKLSVQYSQQLKRLCHYAPPYSIKLSTQATSLERIALRHLKQQLRSCSQPKTISAKFISKMLQNNYQKLTSR